MEDFQSIFYYNGHFFNPAHSQEDLLFLDKIDNVQIYPFSIFVADFPPSTAQASLDTMTFDTGATHPGFTFTNFNYDAGGTIFSADMTIPAVIAKSVGTFDLISFEVGPFVGGNNMRLVSDAGDTLLYNDGTAMVYTLNWVGISTVTIDRPAGGFAPAADLDNFIIMDSSLVVGMDKSLEKNTLKGWPNPFSAAMQLQIPFLSAPETGSLTVTSVKGDVVYGPIPVESNSLLSLSGDIFTPGVYFVQLVHPKRSTWLKVVRSE